MLTVLYLAYYDTLLQNVVDIITKLRQLFYYKMRQRFITKCVWCFITKCESYY